MGLMESPGDPAAGLHYQGQRITHLLKINFRNFIIFWMHWVFVAACELSLVVVSSGSPLFVVVARLLVAVVSLVEHCLNSCDACA